MTIRAALVGVVLAVAANQASAQTPPSPAPAPAPAPAKCFQSPAECHLAAGKALLSTNPHAAVDELNASYAADRRTTTLALYAFALRLDHRYAASAIVFRRARTRFGTELDAAQKALTEAQAARDANAIASATQLVTALGVQIQNADQQLAGLESQTGHVHLKFAGSADIVVVHKNEGDIKDPFTETILVNADDDTLVVTYPDGKTVEIPVKVAGGTEQTVVVPAEAGPPKVDDHAATTAGTTNPTTTVGPAKVDATEPRGHTRRSIGIGTLAGGAIALGAAVVFQVQANHDWDDAQGAGCTGDACVRGSAGASLAQDSHDRANLALGGVILGGALAVTGVVLLVLDHHRGESPSQTAIGVAPQAGGVAAFVTGRF